MYSTSKLFLKDDLIAALLSVNGVAGIGAIQTARFLMLDVVSYFASSAVVFLFFKRRYLAFCIALCSALLVKQVMIVFAALLAVPLLTGELKPGKAFLLASPPPPDICWLKNWNGSRSTKYAIWLERVAG